MALKNISLNIKLCIMIIFCCILQCINSKAKVDYNSLNYTDLVPLHYDVKIDLDFNRNMLWGECDIIINITHRITHINVSSVNFGVFKIDLIKNDNNQIINVEEYSLINRTYIYTDFTKSSVNILLPGIYTLQIIYARHIYRNEIFFGHLYDEEKGEKVLTESGIEIFKAQQLFPCWVEPAFESTFTISIKHHKQYNVLSNMFRKVQENERNIKLTRFYKSPLMSIQHLTIVITTFFSTYSNSENASIWCRENMTEYVSFALDIIEQVVTILKKRSVTKIPKIDYFVIWDTQHSNIETWGLIVHREEDITHLKSSNSVTRKIEVASLIVRQIVSVWYDYLLWPIEGFTTFFTTHVLREIESLSYISDLFVIQIQQESFRFEIPSNTNTTLLNSNGSNVEINKAFLNYIKPSVLWFVLQHLPTEHVFLSSIQTYAYRYIQSNTVETDDLWHIMQINLNRTVHPLHFNIKKYIDIWKKTNYYPIVYVTRNDENKRILFSYLASSDFIDKNVEQLPVLVTVRATLFGRVQERAFWLSPQETNSIGEIQTNECFIINIKPKGYYRVYYDLENWHILAQCLSEMSENYEVSVLDQAQIIDDAFYFLKNGQLSVTMFWNLARILSRNTKYIAWYPMIKAFEYMACAYSLDDTRIRIPMIKLLDEILQVIGYDISSQDTDLIISLIEETAKWACIFDVAKCRETATLQLIEDLESPVQDNFGIWKEWKYCRGLMSANYTIWNNTLQKWMTTSDNRILDYLTCNQNSFIITTYLNLTLGLSEHKSIIKEEGKRANIVLLTIAKHIKNHEVLDFLFKRLESKQFKLSNNSEIDMIAILIVSITNMHNLHQLQKVKSFVSYNLDENRIFEAVVKKLKDRKSEYAKHNANYESLKI